MSRVSRGFRITGKVIKYLFFLLVFTVIGLLLWRIFSASDPDSVKTVTPNEALCAAYEEHGEKLYLFRQDQRTITSGENNYGYFSVTDCLFIPDANQIQLIFRYNNSTLRSLAEDYDLAEVPSREEELFDVSLTVATDLTPNEDGDNAGNDPEAVSFTRVFVSEITSDTKNMYNYRRMVFQLDGEELDLKELLDSGELLAIYADVYYNEDIRYDEPAYGTLCLYDYLSEKREASLTREDRRALAGE